MKKLFVILLAVALTLSLAAVASAATFAPYVGGEFQLTYKSQPANTDYPWYADNGDKSMMKAYVTGEVKDDDTNTWARIGAKITCWTWIWNNPATGQSFDVLYSAGVKKVAGIMDIQYSTDDYETTLRGQTPLVQDAAKFGGDPYFCNRLTNAFGFDINTDNVTVNIGATAGIYDHGIGNGYTTVGDGMFKKIVAAGTFKFDAGKVYVGYASLGTNNSNMIVGAEMKLGFGTLKADYYSVATAVTNSIFQANVGFDEMKLNATLMYTMPAVGDSVIGLGVEYSGIDKFTVGAKYVDKDILTEVYGIYKAGIFDIRPGYAKMGAGDGFFYLALHAGLW